MNGTKSSAAVRAIRQAVTAAAALLAMIATVFLGAIPSEAKPRPVDTRAELTVSSSLPEPSWVFVGRTVEILVFVHVPAGETRVPTGTLTLTAQEAGAVPQTKVLENFDGGLLYFVVPGKTGTRYYTVSYSGDQNFKPAGERVGYEVLTGPETRTKLYVGQRGSLLPGEPVTLTAQVSAAGGGPLTGFADGPIVFFADGAFLGTGTVVPDSRGWRAVLTVDSLAVGTHRLTANHDSPLRYFGPESDPVFLTVKPAP